jgi:hypothetical protein
MKKVTIIAVFAALMAFAMLFTSCDFTTTNKSITSKDSTELVVDSLSIAMDSTFADSVK